MFLGGSLLYALFVLAYEAAPLTNFLPTILILGSFLVPVTFAVHFVEDFPPGVVPLSVLAWCAFGGGLVGLLVAGLLEYEILQHYGTAPMLLGAGLIEESAKLLTPLWFYARGRYRSEAAGLLMGISAGMGYAVLETMGFGLQAIIATEGQSGPLQLTLLLRGLLSPASHMAWTGLVCAVLWRERERSSGHTTFNLRALAAFGVAVVLHTLWDNPVLRVGSEATEAHSLVVEMASLVVPFLPVVIVGLLLLFRRPPESRRAL